VLFYNLLTYLFSYLITHRHLPHQFCLPLQLTEVFLTTVEVKHVLARRITSPDLLYLATHNVVITINNLHAFYLYILTTDNMC